MPPRSLTPSDYQPSLPLERLILAQPAGGESVPLDVLFVGGGPAGLAGAIELKKLVAKERETGGTLQDLEIGVVEKAAALGEHCLSGAVVNPRALRELFPDVPVSELPLRRRVEAESVFLLSESGKLRLPTPPTMRNEGNHVASICEIVRWLGQKAEGLGVNVFTGFPADALLVEGRRVMGVRTTAAGLAADGTVTSGSMPATDLTAQVTVLSEGTRGALTQAWLKWQEIQSPNPQIYALGVKELWETRRPLRTVIHTLGWPLPRKAFGGSWIYPLDDNLVSLGLVVGLDYREASLDVHVLLQRFKRHPLAAELLRDGELVEWGAKTIPEGGYYSLPERLHGDGLLLAGDAAGLVDVASLKGIHYAMQSGMFAARAIFSALKAGDTSAKGLESYDGMVRQSYIASDLHRTRNMRLAFKSGFWLGGFKAALATLSRGALPSGRIAVRADADEPRELDGSASFTPDGKLTYSKLDAVFRSGNATRDDIPSHLLVNPDVPPELATFYEHMCPAGVYERQGDKLVVNAPNCIDCKTTDVLGPRWMPREGGSGPKHKRM